MQNVFVTKDETIAYQKEVRVDIVQATPNHRDTVVDYTKDVAQDKDVRNSKTVVDLVFEKEVNPITNEGTDAKEPVCDLAM